MEFLGGLATIGQLTGYAVSTLSSTLEVYYRLRLRSDQFDHQLNQIRRLRDTVKGIRESSTLHVPGILDQLRALVESIHQLEAVAKPVQVQQDRKLVRRFIRTCLKDPEFNRLEQILLLVEADKTALLLTITSAQTCIVGEINQKLSMGFPRSKHP